MQTEKIVQKEWLKWRDGSDDNPIQTFKKITKSSMAQLQIWSKEAFGGREKKIKELMKKLERTKQCNVQYEGGD